MKRKAILMLAGCMLMTAVTGCSFLPPKTAVDVVERYQAALEKTENFKVEGAVDLEMSIGVKGEEEVAMSVDIPISMELEALTDGKDNIYMNMDLSMEAMGEKVNSEIESYMQLGEDAVVTYTSTDGGAWVKSEDDSMPDLLTGEMDASQFEEGTFEKKDDKYIVTLNMEKIAESDMFEDMLKENDELFAYVDIDELQEQLGKAVATYTFDKECMLEKMELADFEFAQDIDISGVTAELSMAISAEINMKDYGEVDKEAYLLPDDVKDEAVEESEQEDTDISLEETMTEPTEEPEDAELPEEEPVDIEVPEEEPEEAVGPEEETEEPEVDSDTNETVLESGAYALYDYDGNLLCEVNCPQNFNATEVTENSVIMEDADGYGIYIFLLPDVWMEEYITTGTFTKDEEFYSYEDVSTYSEYESAYGTVTILQRDYTMVGFEDLGVSTTYGVMLNKGEYSPCFTVDAENLETWGTDIETLTKEIFK